MTLITFDAQSQLAREGLTGLSGAEIQLVTDVRGHWIVRKIARDVAGSDRLRRQAAKQYAFSQMGLGLSTPAVLREGEIDGRYFFEMEYIRGLDGGSFLRSASYADVTRFVDQLADYLSSCAVRAPLCTSVYSSFFEALFCKCCEVQRLTNLMSAESMSSLFLMLDRLRAIDGLSPTLCHGDLTLKNLIIDHQGTIWALDLLDSPFEHYWQDIAKLHQDLVGGWFLVDEPPIAACVLDHVSRRLLHLAEGKDGKYLSVHYLLVATTFVRILPYAKTPEQIAFVLERINYFTTQGRDAVQQTK